MSWKTQSYPRWTTHTSGGTGALLEVVRPSRSRWALHCCGSSMLLEGQGFVRAASDTLLATLRQHRVTAIAEARDRRHRHKEQRGAQTDADQRRRRYCNENNYN